MLTRIFLVSALTFFLSSCLFNTNTKREEQLAKVAKDWSLVIRASQVIPLYPLHQDIRPGDIFLVETTVDEQHREYTRRGFLSMDHHIARITPSGYTSFYGLKDTANKKCKSDCALPGLEPIPIAAFPSYSFEVGQSAGFDIALPIQSVSLGVGLLGSNSAAGSVSIKSAYTYGVDINSLTKDVMSWKASDGALLNFYGPQPRKFTRKEKYNYIRVINRVFLAQGLEVFVLSKSDINADAQASLLPLSGLAKLSSSGLGVTEGVSRYSSIVKELNCTIAGKVPVVRGNRDVVCEVDKLTDELPRATIPALPLLVNLSQPTAGLRITSLSARSVGMQEYFPTPVVIGYHAFDMAILVNGDLGPPVPTLAVLDKSTEHSVHGGLRLSKDTEIYNTLLTSIREQKNYDEVFSLAINEMVAITDNQGIRHKWDAEKNKGRARPNRAESVIRRIVNEEASILIANKSMQIALAKSKSNP